jgi:signal-transduction protein with cAMP-binding, CBS, and nucleotidyltransferase domain
MNRAQHQLMQIVQKIPVFDGLSLEQAEVIMWASRFKKYEAGDTIYDVGEASDEMVILIKGTLSVLSASGQSLGEVGAGNSTGRNGCLYLPQTVCYDRCQRRVRRSGYAA